MKKRITAFLLALCMALALLPGAALAAEPGGVPEDREWTDTPEEDTGPELMAEPGWVSYPVTGGNLWFDPSTKEIVDCDAAVTEADIPNNINGVPVTGIGDGAFWNCQYLTKVTIPSSVTIIQQTAFGICHALTSVTIPSSVTTIQLSAFTSCTSLTSITIPGSVTTMGESVFIGCTQLKTAGPIGSGCNIEFGWSSEIPAFAFKDCRELERVILPDSITKIGKFAFYYCANLKEVMFSGALTCIEMYAFRQCKGLERVILPDTTTKIGVYAFAECENLKEVKLSRTLACIEEATFRGCKGLENITIPGSVTTIALNAFAECSGLRSVTILDGVTWIDQHVFYGCSSLESITLPASLQVVYGVVFSRCTNLRYVVILNSKTEIGGGNFESCENLTDIYFNGNEAAWAFSGRWLHLPESVTVHFNSKGPGSLSSVVTKFSNHQYILRVVDPDGNSLQGASVQVENKFYTTDEYGTICLGLAGGTPPKVTVNLNGYSTWVRPEGEELLPVHYETAVLQPLSNPDLGTLNICRFYEDRDMSNAVDLLTCVQTVALGENDSKLYYIKCAASVKEGESGTVSRYQLWQNKRKIQEAPDGLFAVYPSAFEPNEDCYIRVYVGDAYWDTSINLKFQKLKLEEFPEKVDLGASISSISVPEETPLLGGNTLELNFARYFPVTVTASDKKICMGVNFKEVADKEAQAKEARDLFRRARRSGSLIGGRLSAQDQKIYNSLIRDKQGWSKESWEFNVLGYLEGDLGGSTFSGSLILQVKSPSATFKYNTWVSVVPVTVQVEISAEGGLTGAVSYNWKQEQLSGSLELSVSGSIHVFGGVGVDEYVAVGAYGEPKLELDLHILNTPMKLTYLGLKGTAGLEAYFAGQNYTLALLDGGEGWQIWPRKESTASLFSDGEDWYDPENWELQDLSYLEEESAWLGDGVSLYDAGASTALTALRENTYRDARPVLVSGVDGPYAAFLQADAKTGNIYTAVTKHDGTRWLDPVRVDQDAVLDSVPVLLANGNDIWLAYGRTADSYDKTTMSSYAQNQSIVVGKLNPETLTFTETATDQKEYPGNGAFSHLQTLGLMNGVPTLAWVESEVTDDNSVLRPASGTIYTASYDREKGTWGEAVLVETVDGPVTQVVAGDTGVAYVSNGTLYQAGDGSKVLAENVQGRVTFGQAADMKDPDFLWNGDDCLETASGTSIPAAGITREYALSGNRIYYSAPDEKGAHLTAVLYEGGTWSAPITLTGGERYLENLSVVSWKGNSWLMGMDTTAQITGDGVEASKDLVWAEIQPSSDLRLDGVSFEEEGMTPGEPVNVTLYVTNAGDHTVSSGNLKVTLNGNFWTPDSNSLTSLAPGESAELTGSITCPSEPTEYTFAVAETGKDDFTPNDNRFDTSLGHARLSVALSEQKIGDSRALYALVSNDGIATSAPGSVLFCNGAGTVLEEASFQALAPGDSAVILCTGDLYGDYTATLSSTSAGDVFGDMDTVFIDGTPGTVRSVTRSGSSVTAEISARRNGTAYCAFYGENQRLLDVREAAFTEKTRKLDFSGPAEFSKAKVFLTDGTGTPLCPAKSTP